MAFFVNDQNYTRTIEDPDTGETAEVTFRPLNAGDQAELLDTIRMQVGEDASPDLKLGAFQMLMLERAITAWTLEVAPTKDTIKKLHPNVFQQLVNFASFGSAPEEESDPNSDSESLMNKSDDSSVDSHQTTLSPV